MAQLTGTLSIKVDGDTIFSKSGQFTFNKGGYERTAQNADFQVIGFTKKPVPAVVSGTCQHTSETDMDALADHENVSLVLDTDSGQSWLVRNAFATKPPELSGENGDMAVEYSGVGPAERVK